MGIIRFTPYGWRGRYDEDFTEDSVIRITTALGKVWAERTPGSSVLIGYDGRYSSESFALLAGKVLAESGLRAIVSTDICPLPALAWSAAHTEACAGALMVSASEESSEYGGLIVRGTDGGPISELFARRVERLVGTEAVYPESEISRADFVAPYLKDLCDFVDLDKISNAHLRLVVDPMYGAASGYLFRALEAIGCSVTQLHAGPQDDFGGLHPQPVEPWADECEQVVQCQKADVGLLLSGDGNRAAIVDERGRLVTPHNMIPVVLAHLVRDCGEKGRVVTTLASSMRTERLAHLLGLSTTAVPVGFSRIYGEILQKDVLMAAEEYGGICLPKHLYERDGLLVCLLVLEVLATAGCPLSQVVADITREIGPMDYIRRDIRLDAGEAQSLENVLPGLNPSQIAGRRPTSVNHADGLRLQFSDGSWCMLRPSRSGNVARVYAEAPNSSERDELLTALCELARDPQMWRNCVAQ
jgi:phosphomannomutase